MFNNRIMVMMIVVMLIFTSCNKDGEISDSNGTSQQVVSDLDASDGEAQSPVAVIEEGQSTDVLPEILPEVNDEDVEVEAVEPDVEPEPAVEPEPESEPVNYEALTVNEVGHIMVVMYHGIKDNPPYHITKENFNKDLTYMYEHGYRLISMADYLDQNISVEAGMTPIVFTFDDALPSTFSLIETDDGLIVDGDTAIGILEAFVVEHPDFGKSAALFMHDSKGNFNGDGDVYTRLNWLIDHGYEIGNHSATHADLSKLSLDGLIKEIGQVDEFLLELEMSYNMRAITYPYGKRPKEDIIGALKQSMYNDVEFDYEVAFREGPSSSLYAPIDVRFSPFNAPRVRGSSGAIQDMWWFFDFYDVGNSHLKYVSDGDPSTVVVPTDLKEYVNVEALDGKVLITY